MFFADLSFCTVRSGFPALYTGSESRSDYKERGEREMSNVKRMFLLLLLVVPIMIFQNAQVRAQER